ncbi:DUF4099 domain-containing protein [Gaoshiqia sediminis]|uniref:DUF4099 domain-containing protein n=1 Tax=Gaoshiqia sediminis TaxID=2986998 RepID=A0AA41YAL6_9BACT|nr:DUF4099 domain-containing protein [Gaoshiqia sediminis]MCW0484766.1 DUF4099 domain-containing protein [Gaoshiqia sediminis]
MEQSTRMSMDQIPFDKLEKAGISRELIEKMEKREMTDFLNGFRSDKLYTINARINDQDYKIPAKIRLQQGEDGKVDIRVHPIQRLNVPDEYMGHKFTKEEKGVLLNDKNLGKTVELTGKNDKKFSATLQVNAADRNISFRDFKQEKMEKTEDQKQDAKAEKKTGARQKVSWQFASLVSNQKG